MSKLQDMLRVQARLHRKQGANALGDLFDNSSKEIESLSEKLAKANESALFYKEQYEKTDRECTKLAMRESKVNERVKELEYYNVALANESHNKSVEIDFLNARAKDLKEKNVQLRNKVGISSADIQLEMNNKNHRNKILTQAKIEGYVKGFIRGYKQCEDDMESGNWTDDEDSLIDYARDFSEQLRKEHEVTDE